MTTSRMLVLAAMSSHRLVALLRTLPADPRKVAHGRALADAVC